MEGFWEEGGEGRVEMRSERRVRVGSWGVRRVVKERRVIVVVGRVEVEELVVVKEVRISCSR